MYFNQPSYNITTIKKGDYNYPASLRSLGAEAPETLYCIGNVSLLNEPKALITGKTMMTKEDVNKSNVILSSLKDFHVINMAEEGIEYYVQQASCNSGGKPILMLGGTYNVDAYEYEELKPLVDGIISHDGLVVSLYDDKEDYIDHYYNLNMVMLALSDVVGCLKGDKSTKNIVNMAKRIGKKVLQF